MVALDRHCLQFAIPRYRRMYGQKGLYPGAHIHRYYIVSCQGMQKDAQQSRVIQLVGPSLGPGPSVVG